jgi:uncharacterized protein YqgC (DUF456 family)
MRGGSGGVPVGMSNSLAVLLVGLAMAIGIVGTVLPILPGLALVLAAAVAYGFIVGWNAVAIVAMAVIVLLFGVGSAAKYVLAGQSAKKGGAPRQSLMFAALGAVIGFFVIPVLGLVIGGIGALVVAEYLRTHDWGSAWRSSRTTLLGIGTGVLVEIAAGIAMALTWAVWVVVG